MGDVQRSDGSPAARSRRFVALTAAALLAALALAGYLWRASSGVASDQGAPEPLTIAISAAYPGSCPVFVAQARGYFAAQGLQVTLQPHSSGKPALQAALDGQADIATCSDLPTMFAVMNGQPVAIVATLFRSENDHGIVARRDRGIARVTDLRGKRIGVTTGSSAHFFLDNLLSRSGVGIGEVELVDLGADLIADALARGEVDAVSSWEPVVAQALNRIAGNDAVFHDPAVSALAWNLVGRHDILSGRGATLQRLLRAVDQGAALCSDRPDEAIPIVAAATGVAAAELQQLWASYRFDLTLDQGLVLALEDEARWALQNDLTRSARMPNFLSHILIEPLKAVRPSAVTLVH